VQFDPGLRELTDKRFYGVYRGVVTDSNDPDGLARIRAQVPQILGVASTGWAWPVTPVGISLINYTTTTNNITDGSVYVDPLPIGTGVWVMFEGGDPNFPLWIGTF
jgi:hypothetical protein